ncbi:MAG: hypothetical protein ACKO1M_14355 [Planctomycetota bacterium]
MADLMMVEDRFKPQPRPQPDEPANENVRRLPAEEVLELERQKAEQRRKKG